MASLPYEELKGNKTPTNNNYNRSPRLSDLPSNLVEINLSDNASSPTSPGNKTEIIEMKITSPPKQPQQATENTKSRRFKPRKKWRTPYINMRLKHISKLFDKESIYFGCIAPLRADRIDLHCNELSDLDLKYCCGLYMKVDRSFTIHTILSTEFITSLKKLTLKKEKCTQEFINNNNKGKSVELQVDKKKNDNKQEEKYDARRYVAFHPRDHWEFAKDMEHKNAVIFIHGQNYAPDEKNAAQFIINECMAFYADMPYLVIPFVWPCEGELLDYDVNIIAEEYCATELATFIRRLWVLFERIDFVSHGKGCNILLRAVKLLTKEKAEVVDMSHLVLIAADMDCQIFVEDYVDEIYKFVKRITLYVNTWDWKLYSSKMWNWSSDRVGAVIINQDKFAIDCIDVTQLLSGWFLTSNHYYLTNKYFKLDVIQCLSKIGGVDPQYRNYVLPVYNDTYTTADSLLSSANNNNNVKYYELVDKPYMKIVPEQKQNVRNVIHPHEEVVVDDMDEGDTKQAEYKEEEENMINEEDMNTVTRNLKVLGYVADEDFVIDDQHNVKVSLD